MANYFILLFISIFISRCQGNNLVIVAAGNSFFERCDGTSSSSINMAATDFMAFDLKHDLADDMETLITNGNITVLIDLPPTATVQLHINILKWERGRWENTIYSIRRSDFCSSLFNPTELWYSLSENVPVEERICPPTKGTVYHLSNLENRIELQDVGLALEGQFKILIHLEYGSIMTCIQSVVEIWKN